MADKHFVVTKNTNYIDNNSNNNDDESYSNNDNDNSNNSNIKKPSSPAALTSLKPPSRPSPSTSRSQSNLTLVTGADREREIARMATGGAHTEAGLDLARALLGSD